MDDVLPASPYSLSTQFFIRTGFNPSAAAVQTARRGNDALLLFIYMNWLLSCCCCHHLIDVFIF